MLIRANEHAAGGEDWFVSHTKVGIRNDGHGKSGNERGRMPQPGISAAEDGVSMNRDRLVGDAKEAALALVRGR